MEMVVMCFLNVLSHECISRALSAGLESPSSLLAAMATTVMVPGTPRGAACVSKHCQGLESGSAAPVFVLSGNTQLTKKLQCPAPVFSVCHSVKSA